MAGSVQLSGSSSGIGQRTLRPGIIQNDTDIEETLNVTLESGDNSYAVPLGSVGVIIDPTSVSSTFTLRFRTDQNSSDTGLTISDVHPFLYVFPATAPIEIIINSSAASIGNLILWFW